MHLVWSMGGIDEENNEEMIGNIDVVRECLEAAGLRFFALFDMAINWMLVADWLNFLT